MSINSSEEEFLSLSPVNEIARVSVQVPPFWKTNPALWLKQVESQFITAGITSDSTKFNTIVGSIEANILCEVSDIILQPPHNMYEIPKKPLQERFTDSEEKQLKKLIREIELGDKNPSILLREMSTLASGKVSDELLKNLWMQRLPKRMQAILSVSSESLTKLALMADRIADTWDVNAITSSSSNSAIEHKIETLTKQVEALSLRGRGRTKSRA